MEEVEILCDQIVIMDQGQVIAKGTKESLKDTSACRLYRTSRSRKDADDQDTESPRCLF